MIAVLQLTNSYSLTECIATNKEELSINGYSINNPGRNLGKLSLQISLQMLKWSSVEALTQKPRVVDANQLHENKRFRGSAHPAALDMKFVTRGNRTPKATLDLKCCDP